MLYRKAMATARDEPWAEEQPEDGRREQMDGGLYLTGTPIGNLEDISYRCIRILSEADVIAAEDTRQTQKLLQHYQIKNKLSSYHEHNKREKQEYFLQLLAEGKKIALVTDAGMPGISDPGEDLVKACIERGIPVTTVPGPTAFVSALVLSEQSLREFAFFGFLPVEKKEREEKLKEVAELPYSLVFYEAPHRLLKALTAMAEVFGENRRISLARELTKKYEEVLHFSLAEAVEYYRITPPKGEYVLTVEGKDRRQMQEQAQRRWTEMSLEDHLDFYLQQGMEQKQALKQMAKDRGTGKREIYQYFHGEKE